MTDEYDIGVAATEHADKVLRAAGSALKNYSVPENRYAILSAMLDAIEEAYRAGADFAGREYAKHAAQKQEQGDAD